MLTPNRTGDVYRHRFSAAHELGHLVPHGDASPGDIAQERETDTSAAEFPPRESILSDLPARADLHKPSQLCDVWGSRCTPCCTAAENSVSCRTLRQAGPVSA
ncbi:ImmA/IrrE family metallo-endopeptidase [Streptomyces sp. NPDC015171]|uniref:ImmA/IrrE family metallo-endopeptidase n=1 Tax=Streptomyces sp. NPDC015171 TaxID=3364945 RepID=UPI0036FC5852